MYNGEKVSAVVLAAGKGLRMNMEVNKQYYPVRGIPVLARSLLVFQRSRYVDNIFVVVNKDDIIHCKKEIVDRYSLTKVAKVVEGGSTRQDSSFCGIKSLPSDTGLVLIHDGARPFVSEDILLNSLKEAYTHGASCVCVPVKDTIKLAGAGDIIDGTPDRNKLFFAQTPQTFKYGLISHAFEMVNAAGLVFTDDSQLAEACGYKVKLVNGSYDNIKITTREDIAVAETIAAKFDNPYRRR